MRNTFKVKVRGLGDKDYMLIEDVSTITSNLGGFLLTLKNLEQKQLDPEVEINIIGSDDASPLSIRRLEVGISFNYELFPHSYNYVKTHSTIIRRCNMCSNVLLINYDFEKPFHCMYCDVELLEQESHVGEPCTDIEFNELCNDSKNFF